MKTKYIILSTLITLSCSSIAGDSYSSKSSKTIIPQPTPKPECYLKWFLGASIGTLLDEDEAIISAHIGVERRCPESLNIHALYLEIGHTEYRRRILDPNDTASFFLETDTQIIPLTLNYKFERPLTHKLNWYIGAGAGVAFVDMDVEGSILNDGSHSDTVFYANAFTGIIYNFTPSFEAYLGAKYILMDDPSLTGNNTIDANGSIDGDILIELGARYTF